MLEFALMMQQHVLASSLELYNESKIKRQMLNGRIVFSTERLLPQKLHEVLNSVVECVNLIKAKILNQRIFSCLCTDMDADHQALLLHSEVRWLSRGRVLKGVCDLRGEIFSIIFLRQQNFMALAEKFSQEDINAKIAYLADIFDSLNCLNSSIQGAGFTVIDHAAEVAAYYKNLFSGKATWLEISTICSLN